MAAAYKSGKQEDVTRLLEAWRQGHALAHEELMVKVYPELRKLVAYYLRMERQGPPCRAPPW